MTFDPGKGVAPLLLLLFLIRPAAAHAQVFGEQEGPEITVGGEIDLVNRYVWRGLELSDAASLQPSAWIAIGNVELGTWGSHNLDGDFHEQDFWATYYVPEGAAGSLSLTVNDYYTNPDFGTDFFDFDGIGPCPEGDTGFGTPPRCADGAHTLEVVGAFTAAAAPVDLLVAYNFHNDPEHAFYAEAAYRPTIGPVELGFVAGGVIGDSEYYYGTDGTTLTNLAVDAGTSFTFGALSVPVGVEVIHNPDLGDDYVVAKIGVSGEL